MTHTTLSAALEARDKATQKPWRQDHSTVQTDDYEIADFWNENLGIYKSRTNAAIGAAAPDALDWIAKALPWMKDYRKSITFKKCDDPECQVCANNNKRMIELTALIAQAEVTEMAEPNVLEALAEGAKIGIQEMEKELGNV